MTISCMRRHAPFGPTGPNFCMLGGVTDVINCAKFFGNRFRGSRAGRPWKWHFPLKAFITLTTVLRYRADCDNSSSSRDLTKNGDSIGGKIYRFGWPWTENQDDCSVFASTEGLAWERYVFLRQREFKLLVENMTKLWKLNWFNMPATACSNLWVGFNIV